MSTTGKWRLRWVLVAMVPVLLVPPLGLGLLLWTYSWGMPDERASTHGRDAVWLGHAWVDGRRDGADVSKLAERMRGGGIRDLLVHIGPLNEDGSLDAARYPKARWALMSLPAALPGVRVQAWLGQRVDPGRLDLADPDVRGRIVGSASAALDVGFDGVHFNFEPVPDGHAGLLELLDATHELTRSRGAVLSMSVHHVEPLPLASHLDDAVVGHAKWWTRGYLSQVARRVDQVAVMSYDTALPAEALYTGYVRRQTSIALDAVPADTHLLMGVPAYHDTTWAHRPSAETLAAAVRGIRLAARPVGRREFGVAIYAEFSATEQDWRDYYAEWVRGQP
jgi:hypothetical protein